jgi:large subunit ribosomal protein L25
MKTHALTASMRDRTGKKVAELRRAGQIPATLYGKGMQSLTISLDTKTFEKTYQETGETGLIELSVNGSVYPVLVKMFDRHPVDNHPVHIEFQKVNLTEKIRAHVAIEITGQSLAVKEGIGTLLTLLHELDIEALPTKLPDHITVDISGLAALNDQILVKDLRVPADVVVLTDPEIIVVKIGALAAPEPEPTPPPTEVPVEPAKEGEGEEGVKAEEPQKEEKQEKKEEAPKP